MRTVTSPLGSIEAPINPVLSVLAYGAGFVAQGTPADISGLATLIEQAIRYPGFAFVNVLSPCVTFGSVESQMKTHKARMINLQASGHDATDRVAAMRVAMEYGQALHTGVFYRNEQPEATFEAVARQRQAELEPKALRRTDLLQVFRPL